MTNITLDGLPAKTGTISDAGIIHYRESGVDKKMTVADFLTKISSQYQSFMNTFLGTADKAAARAALDIARRTTVSNADYTILVTDKVVAQIGTMSATRTFTLPSAALYPAGEELIISDQSFTVTKQFPITVSRAGSDTFHDGNTSVNIDFKGGILRLISDGTSKWTILNLGNIFSSSNFTNKNAIINGDFNIWQRGTSFTSISNGTYTADRWIYAKSSSAVHDISRSTDVPTVTQSGRLFNYSSLIDCQTVDSSIAAGDFVVYEQRIEGFNWLPLAQKTITLSFWVKGTKTGIHCIYLKNSVNDRSYVAEYTINSSDTWEFKTVTIIASPASGTWDYTNGIGLAVGFTLCAGSTYQTTANAWQTGGYLATSNQVNACDNIANNFRIVGIQLEVGSVATTFENRSIAQELSTCQRYYQKSYDYSTAVGTSTTNGAYSCRAVSTTYDITVPLKSTMRTVPTVTTRNTTGGTAGQVRNESIPSDITVGAEITGDAQFSVRGATGVSNANRIVFHWEANAEL